MSNYDLAIQYLTEAKKFGSQVEIPKVSASPKSKWKMVSALQKCIRRRNIEDALTMMSGLRIVDRRYMLRRLAITALEDIGVNADDNLLQALFYLNTVNGANQWADPAVDAALVVDMCERDKDRSMCDGVVAHAWNTSLALPESMIECPNVDKAPLCHLLNGWHILGTRRMKHPRWEKDAHDVLGFLSYLKSIGISEADISTTGQILGLGLEGMGLSFAVMRAAYKAHCTELAKDTGEVPMLKSDNMKPVVHLGAYPSYTFDTHTQEGKRAYGYFMAMSDVPTVKRLKEIGDSKIRWGTLEGAVFFAESDRMVDRTQWPVGNLCRELSAAGCIGTPDWKDIELSMESDLDKLDYARHKVGCS